MMGRGKHMVWPIAVLLFVGLGMVFGCTGLPSETSEPNTRTDTTSTAGISGGEDVATIYLAGGCFWGVEKYMSLVEGVTNTEVGYANGTTDSPTYHDVTTGRTGYTETVRVDYDPEVAPLPFLLRLFYGAVDPTSLNRQGNDVGTQYRTGIYYVDPADGAVIEHSLDELQRSYNRPVVIESGPLTAFTSAEDYHQDYLDKNPGGYCHISPGLFDKAEAARPEPQDFEAAAGE